MSFFRYLPKNHTLIRSFLRPRDPSSAEKKKTPGKRLALQQAPLNIFNKKFKPFKDISNLKEIGGTNPDLSTGTSSRKTIDEPFEWSNVHIRDLLRLRYIKYGSLFRASDPMATVVGWDSVLNDFNRTFSCALTREDAEKMFDRAKNEFHRGLDCLKKKAPVTKWFRALQDFGEFLAEEPKKQKSGMWTLQQKIALLRLRFRTYKEAFITSKKTSEKAVLWDMIVEELNNVHLLDVTKLQVQEQMYTLRKL